MGRANVISSHVSEPHDANMLGSASEWLLTDGCGGFSFGTPEGLPARRYHAWFIAALRPPVERTVILHSAVDGIEWAGRYWALTPFAFGERFIRHPDAELPVFVGMNSARTRITWTWRLEAGGSQVLVVTRALERDVEPTSVRLRYAAHAEGGGASDSVVLRFRPFMPLRDFHELDHADGGHAPQRIEDGSAANRVLIRRGSIEAALTLPSDAEQVGEVDWWRDFAYAEDRLRGQTWQEDLWSPGEWCMPLTADAEQCAMLVRVEQADHDDALITSERIVAPSAASRDGSSLEPADVLTHAAEQFLTLRPMRSVRGERVAARSVLAGYPWFTDWGRDTMISLPGLLLVSGRENEARSMLHLFAARMRGGLLPNCFDDVGDGAVYHTADASLWFLVALGATLGERAGADDRPLLGAAREIIAAYAAGTDFGIGVDEDGLVRAGDGTRPVTWMDARRDGVSFTPRVGKPVELSALWHHGLHVMARLTDDLEERDRLLHMAAQTAKGMQRFHRPGYGLHDVLESDGAGGWRGDARIRPNQLFALSLMPMCVSVEVAREVLTTVRLHLLTPYGLRTLSPDDPAYRGRYEGTLFERDAAYHQGTVWPWLLGPYVDALLNVFGSAAAPDVRAVLAPILSELPHGCWGQLAEVYDGDAPHRPSGCPAQAWSVAEVRRVLHRRRGGIPVARS